jgi:hypothetical protein
MLINGDSIPRISARRSGPKENRKAETMQSHGPNMSLQKSLTSGKSQGSSFPVAVELTMSKKYAAKNPMNMIQNTMPISGKEEAKENIRYNTPPMTIMYFPELLNGEIWGHHTDLLNYYVLFEGGS